MKLYFFGILSLILFGTLLLANPVYAQTTPTPTPNSSPCNYTDLSAHEKTLVKFNCFNQPKELAVTVDSGNPSFFTQWLNTAQAVLIYFGFKSPLKNQEQFHSRAELEHTATLPLEVKAETTNELLQTGEDLGSEINQNARPDTSNVQAATSKEEGVGIYQVTQPKELQKSVQKVCDYEKSYENAWFPKGIVPVSGGDCQ